MTAPGADGTDYATGVPNPLRMPPDLAPDAGGHPDPAGFLEGRHVTLADAHGVVRDPGPDDVRRRLDAGGFFWLDVHEPEARDVSHLAEMFHLHPLVVEDIAAFGQRPKADAYGDHALVVAYGAADDEDNLVEVHSVVGPTWLVTLHRDDCLAFPRLFHRLEGGLRADRPGAVLHRVLDALTDSFFPLIEAWDERVDALQDEIVSDARDAHLREAFAIRQQLWRLRRVASPQRDVFAQLAAGTADLPGVDDEDRRYFRDVYDHMIRLADMVDALRDLLTSVIEVYLGMVANRRDQVMKQLTVIATIFLPLTFLTGYFGQNFGWMVDHVGSWQAWALGTAIQVLAVVGILAYFRRRGWA